MDRRGMGKEGLRRGFSLRREVAFIAVGSIVGAFAMFAPRTLAELAAGTHNYVFWTVVARIVGSDSALAGGALHVLVATIIGIVTGLILYKARIVNISRLSSGLVFGLFAGAMVFAAFAIPVKILVLGPETVAWLMETTPGLTREQAEAEIYVDRIADMADSLAIHLVWGAVTGVISSILTIRAGANYGCRVCDVQFERLDTYRKHMDRIHGADPDVKRIVIIGGGFGGVGVLRRLQSRLERNVGVSIHMVSRTNFFLHTPMLAEMAAGTIEPRHIATPVRNFCKRARFHQARALSVDLEKRKVVLEKSTGDHPVLDYDYLVVAAGSKTNYFGNEWVEKHGLTIKTLQDAINLRNHIITKLEEADQEPDEQTQRRLATFVIVGGGFSGVETAGELNDFVRDSAEKFYPNVEPETIRMVLVASGEEILPEIGTLGKHAHKSLEKNGVEILTKTRLSEADGESVTLNNGTVIPCETLVWAGGNTAVRVVAGMDCEHHKSGKIMVDEYMRVNGRPGVYALGDCAYAMDAKSGQPYPPTAQHAIRQAIRVADNIVAELEGKEPAPFSYSSKGTMAKIGKKDGVALLMGSRLTGVPAWFIWKQYYLSTLPMFEKRIGVGIDWLVEVFFSRDITRLDSK